jgi:hypothetical protein
MSRRYTMTMMGTSRCPRSLMTFMMGMISSLGMGFIPILTASIWMTAYSAR